VLQARGELDEALRIRRDEELPVYERLGDVRAKAVAMGKIADVLQARGELDEALQIWSQQILSAFEQFRLGNDNEVAFVHSKIVELSHALAAIDGIESTARGPLIALQNLSPLASSARAKPASTELDHRGLEHALHGLRRRWHGSWH
jgi:hypothetical protein